MRMGVSALSASKVSVKGFQPAMPLRTAATQNNVPINRDSQTGRAVQAFRQKYVIGADQSELVVCLNNRYLGTTEEVSSPSLLPDLTFFDMVIQTSGGAYHPVTFGGSRSFTIAGGEFNKLSDAIAPAVFSLSKFAKGEEYFLRGKIQTAAAHIPNCANNVSDATGQQCAWYDPSVTTPSAADAGGAWTFTGTAVASRTSGYRPVLLGRPLLDGPSFIGIGDSIMEQAADGASAGRHGRGFFQRAMRDAADIAVYPGINLAKTGIGVRTGYNMCNAMMRYARYAVDQACTNDIGQNGTGDTTALKTKCVNAWAEMRASGIEKIIRTTLIPRTTGPWADVAGQTINAGWGPAGKGQEMNDWFSARRTDGTIEHLCEMNGIRGGAVGDDFWKFIPNGTADGTHPLPIGHEAMAVNLRAVLAGLEANNGHA